MKARAKFMIGGAVVLGTMGFLMYGAIDPEGLYLTPGDLLAKRAGKSTFATVSPVQIGAHVVPGSIKKGATGFDYAFRVAFACIPGRPASAQAGCGPDTLAVAFTGVAPDLFFTDSVDVLMEGVLDNAGTFMASTVKTKCASRYEVAPTGPNASRVSGSATTAEPPTAKKDSASTPRT